jgi:toxin ParE1/3/4
MIISMMEALSLLSIRALYEYGILHYGQERADRYYNGLVERCEELAENPRLWQAVDHIYPGYRRSVYGRHSIYYRLTPRKS